MSTAEVVKTPGQRLRDLRAAKGWTQIKLAVRANVAANTIAFAERDERYPDLIRRERIARALGVDRRAIWPEEREAAS
jgi:transcriptional regulator with XRE-family HTH domain